MAPYDTPSSLTLPSTEQLLLSGGDARITLTAEGKANRYGCAPHPDPEILAFGSSTATAISTEGFAAAAQVRQRLVSDTVHSPAHLYARELDRVRSELGTLCGLDDLPRPDIVFAASGTDLHLIAAALAGPVRVILAGAEETGRGVPLAIAGCHFSTRSALGKSVEPGIPAADADALELVTVPIRTEEGTPRLSADIDADVEALALEAISMARRVLLIVVDVSKTGIIAPSPSCAARLRTRFEGALDVLVDACQFRISPSTMRAYLQQEFMVAVTGSKFLTGPTFSGALFIPHGLSGRLRKRVLAPTLSAYCTRADWPADWIAAQALDHAPNFGLLLRWEAALQELRAFRAVSETRIATCLRSFASAIGQRLHVDPAFAPVPVPALRRFGEEETTGWDPIQTIFPFLLLHPATGLPLDREQTMKIHQSLQYAEQEYGAVRCQLGQPVDCGERNGLPVSALRICASARLVVEAARRDGERRVIAQAMSALDKAAMLVRHIRAL